MPGRIEPQHVSSSLRTLPLGRCTRSSSTVGSEQRVDSNRLDVAHVANVRIVDKRFYSLSYAYDGNIFVALNSRDPFDSWVCRKQVRR